MKTFFTKLVGSGTNVSSKRVITLLAFLLMAIGFVSNLFWGLHIDSNVYNSMQWIVLGGLGFTASEMFSSNYKRVDEINDNPDADDDDYDPNIDNDDNNDIVPIKKRGE